MTEGWLRYAASLQPKEHAAIYLISSEAADALPQASQRDAYSIADQHMGRHGRGLGKGVPCERNEYISTPCEACMNVDIPAYVDHIQLPRFSGVHDSILAITPPAFHFL